MCAAPGSKTTQILEMIGSGSSLGEGYLPKGGVVANDMDTKRAYMLTHQIKRLGSAGMAVINHQGQFVPSIIDLSSDENGLRAKVLFDKILVDVPCTGDGAIRKIPTKWAKWSTHEAFSLHGI